jgi:hypothetical protein
MQNNQTQEPSKGGKKLEHPKREIRGKRNES